jgi:hypothetical protein
VTRAESDNDIPFHRPSIGEGEIAAAVEVLRSGWLTTGAKAHELEERFAKRIGVKHALALNSATAGLHLGLEAGGIGPGDEVVMPTWTFTACGEVCTYRGRARCWPRITPRGRDAPGPPSFALPGLALSAFVGVLPFLCKRHGWTGD